MAIGPVGGALAGLSAYQRAAGVGRPPETGPAGAAGAAGVPAADFAQHLGRLVTDTSGALKSAEAASARQVAGKGDLIDVVTAIGAAETALDTMVAVRDRVISAYSEIMRMQI
ncbi:MAG: flagellar hook-basal body complex protein FliE [Sandaracinobacter sp.]